MTIIIRKATEADMDQVATVASASFLRGADPISTTVFPSRLQPETMSDQDVNAIIHKYRLERKTLKLLSPAAILVIAVDDALDNKVVGFSVWEPPLGDAPEEKEPFITCELLDEVEFNNMKRIVETEINSQFGQRGLRDTWYLDFLGVDSEHHRRGIGKMLLNWGLEECKKQGKDCYLFATPAGEPLYTAAGFENLREVDLFGQGHFSMMKRFS